MHGHEAAHQERLEHVALDLLHQDHAAEHEQRDDRALVDQRHQHRDGAGDERADHRDEGAEEDQHADREHERHPRIAATIIMPSASVAATITVARTNWVSEIQATRPELSTCAARGARREPHDPGPDPVAVGEEEVRREQHDEEAGQHVAERGADLGDLAQDRAAVAWRVVDRSWAVWM